MAIPPERVPPYSVDVRAAVPARVAFRRHLRTHVFYGGVGAADGVRLRDCATLRIDGGGHWMLLLCFHAGEVSAYNLVAFVVEFSQIVLVIVAVLIT